MIFYPIELHTHTVHSDASFTVEALVQQVKDYGYRGFFLTDHNTMSAHQEVLDKRLNADFLIMKGVEWTTFYGHMLVLGGTSVGKWYSANLENIDSLIEKIRGPQVVVAMAHPLAIGNPICTGCRWEFKLKNWDNIDYMEVWNGENPHEKYWNDMAYQLWVEKINQGHKIACGSGRDWHRASADSVNVAVTYIGLENAGDDGTATVGLSQETVVAAIKQGRMYATLGPRLDFSVRHSGRTFYLGDTCACGSLDISLRLLGVALKPLQQFGMTDFSFRLYNNREYIIEESISLDTPYSFKIDAKQGFVRCEVFGTIKGAKNTRLLVASPVYVGGRS